MNTVPNTLLVFLFSAIFVGVCPTPQAAPNASASLAGDKKLVVGIWAMQALNEGRTNVAEFRPDGQLLLHAFNCVASSQEPTDVMRYSVADDGKVINMILPTKTIELKVLTFSPQFMQLTSRTGGMEIRYDFEKVDDVDSVCERYPELKAEKARNTPYASSDFVAAPAIPEHPGMERYLGTWGSNNVAVVEILRDAADGFYLSMPGDGTWHYLYNDVHWVGDELHFQSYTYSDNSASFPSPKHKQRIPTSLTPMSDGILRQNFTLFGDPYLGILTRMK
ncbi:hypothetical protein [Pseudomonas sp. AF03-9]|uniref:hypothetical protein n=1 Tax=Pseudomonas sp. AF03-9 TaxID=2849867 RepID=UPI001CF9DF29|nr:hypothetical protein [Pseudomonas sp. AF03-9]